MSNSFFRGAVLASSALGILAAGCDDGGGESTEEPSAFQLRFAASANGKDASCTEALTGLGPDGKYTVGVSDLRFYVSNVQLRDAAGEPVEVTLDDSEFQYNAAAGSVALIDLTGNTEGTCAGSAIAFAEGTARTNAVVSGKTVVGDVASVSFDVGVPQALMKETIATNTAEGAPSPLNEMYWSWATGYRHFVLNFTVEDGSADGGEGYLHIGSRDCGSPDGLALEDQESCSFVNTPSVTLKDFDLETDTVNIDLAAMLDALDFVSPIYDLTTFEVIGEGPGVECHSSPMQPDCEPIFTSFGIDFSTGAADATANEIFSVR